MSFDEILDLTANVFSFYNNNEAVFCLQAKKPLHNGSYEHRVPKIQNQTFFCTRDVKFVCLVVCVIQHRNWPPRSTILNAHGTNTISDGLCTRTHTNEAFSCWFCVIRLELIEPGAATCVYQAKACSPTDQPVRKFKDGLGINMTMKTFFTLAYHIM